MSAMLQYNGINYGMITLSIPKILLFDPEEKKLIEELSTDMHSVYIRSNLINSARKVKKP